MIRFIPLLFVFLAPEVLAAASDPLTIGDADRMAQETATVIAISTGAISFFLGWLCGSNT